MVNTDLLYKIADELLGIAGQIKDAEVVARRVPELPVNNPKIARGVMEYIAAGYSPDNACLLVAMDTGESFARVRAVYDENRISTAAVRYCERKFFCEQLRKKGFTLAQIADKLDVTAPTVLNYLKGKK